MSRALPRCGRGLPDTVPGVTINRFLLFRVAVDRDAAERIRSGGAEIILAGGCRVQEFAADGGTSVAVAGRILGWSSTFHRSISDGADG